MGKLKLMTILGTRPEIIRLSAVIRCADRYFDHILVHTGQNWDYTLNQIFFEDLGLREPDAYLDCAGGDLGQTMGNIIARSYEILCREHPDALLILGDTNSALAAIMDHISDINLPYTEHSRRYLLNEGMDGKTIFVTGSPMREVLRDHAERIEQSDVLERLKLKKGGYILLSAHREENIDDPGHFELLMSAVNDIAAFYQMPVIYSTHPRSRKRIEAQGFVFHPLVQSLEPFGFLDYNKLQKNAYCVLSDSGTLSEESAMLGFPAVLIRTSTERPEVLDKGTIVIGGIEAEDIRRALDLAVAMAERGEETVMAEDYADTNVSVKVIKIIESYAKIVRETTWRV